MRLPLPCVLAAVVAACSGSTHTIGRTDLELVEPQEGAQVFSGDPLAIRATASDSQGVKTLSLAVGSVVAKTCAFDPTTTADAECDVTKEPQDYAAQVHNHGLNVSATLVNGAGQKSSRSALVIVSPLVVRFVSPAPANPAKVSGTSTLSVDVRHEVLVDTVAVTFDGGAQLTQWTEEPYTRPIDWAAVVNPGAHTLTATATDAQGRTATAKLDVLVACGSDGDCEGGQRCCQGTCAAKCP